MTGTTISNVKNKSLFMGNAGNNTKVQEAKGTDCFSEIFNKTQSPAQAPEKETLKKDTAVKAEDTESIQNHANMQKKTSEPVTEKTEEVKNIKGEETVEEAAMMAAEEMVGKIAETFDVTVEEVEQVLETLGLSALDLLNSENLTQVVLALNPDCDVMTLMTNEELYADLKGLMDLAQNWKSQIVENYCLSEEDMAQVLNTLKEQEAVPASVEMDVAEPVVVEMVDAQEGKVTNEVHEITDRHAKLTDVSAYDGTVIPKTEHSQELRSNSSKTGEDSGNGNAASQNVAQNFVNQLAEAVENANVETTSYGVRGQDIINQITEQIRVHVKQDTTEMELQLHPASLGNVKVQITSAGGVMTAVFTTENEAVKTALESQLIQLKENFAQQGLKVESVEVNVSAQGFERSLDQQEQEQRRFEDSRSKKANRRIRLNGIGDSEDILAEEIAVDDRIVADMMIRNGNTVDYTV